MGGEGGMGDPRSGNAQQWVWEAKWGLFSQSQEATEELRGRGIKEVGGVRGLRQQGES